MEKQVTISLENGSDVTIIATGVMVFRAVKAGKILSEEGISAEAINCSTLKPLDNETIVDSAKKTKAIVTVEDHNIINGLGSAVSELLAKECPTVVEFIIGCQKEKGEG